jgi:phenylpropionate dioxygenase-like ring-hydroxylating dioxygenase large terminal subunit
MLKDPILLNDWHVVARSSDIGPGTVRSARLLGEDLVLWHDGQSIRAWLDRCRHRGAKLSIGRCQAGRLTCAYHGWCYDGTGACVLVPAHDAIPEGARVHAHPVRLRYGLVWVCLGTPAHEVPLFPEWDAPGFRTVSAGPYRFRALGTRVLENFLDVGHYPFVHGGFTGDPERLRLGDYQVEEGDPGPVARDIGVRRVWRPGPGGTGEVDVRYTYRALRPLTGSFTKEYSGECFAMFDTVTPVDLAESLVWTLMAVNYETGSTDRDLIGYQDEVTSQDVPIVESQSPGPLPLGPDAEAHVPSDRMSVAYRRWLRKLGLVYGTLPWP